MRMQIIKSYKPKSDAASVADQRGQLLLELLLTISVAAIVLAITGSLVYVSARANQNSVRQTTALGLAQETLEAVNAATKENWTNLSGLTAGTTQYSPAISSGKWIINSGSATVTLDSIAYTRSFVTQNICRDSSTRNITGITDTNGSTTACTTSGGAYDSSTQKVTATVGWGTFGNSLSQSEYFARWANKTCTQTSWAGGASASAAACTGGTTFTNSSSVTTGADLHL